MEAKWYSLMVRVLDQLPHPRKSKTRFSDRIILRVYLWAAVHDRTTAWAANPRHWPADMPHALPSESTMSRRLRTVSFLQLLERLLRRLTDLFPNHGLIRSIDSKPMLVGHASHDADARWGKVGRGKARGYRLHFITCGNVTNHWTIRSMNEHDSTVAPSLLPQLAGAGGYLLGDNAYDTNELHQMATKFGHQLVSPPRKVNRGKRDVRHNCPQRLRALDMLDSPLRTAGVTPGFGPALYARRTDAERGMAALAMLGLSYLPPWVRGPRRVATWVAAKMVISFIQMIARDRQRKQALRN